MFKKLGILCLIFIIITNSFKLNVSANTNTYFDTKGYYNYVGNIGKHNIYLSIYVNENNFKTPIYIINTVNK